MSRYSRMSRAKVFIAAAGLTLAGATATSAVELKVSHFLPPNHTFQKTMEAWGEELAEKSNGELTLVIYPAGQLGGGPNRQFDAARNGISDIAISLHGATPGRYPMTELVSLPFGVPASAATSENMSRRLTELAPEYLADEHEGLKILWMAVTPPLMFHTTDPITSIDDFQGRKIRYAGTQFKNAIEALGAVPMAVPPQETQDALAKGIVDGATFPYEGAASFDLGTVAGHTLEPGIASATFAVVMNPAAYDALPDNLKTLIDETTGPDAAAAFGAAWDAAEVAGKEKLEGDGVEVSVLPDEELARMKALMAPQTAAAIQALEDEGKPAQAFYDAYTQ